MSLRIICITYRDGQILTHASGGGSYSSIHSSVFLLRKALLKWIFSQQLISQTLNPLKLHRISALGTQYSVLFVNLFLFVFILFSFHFVFISFCFVFMEGCGVCVKICSPLGDVFTQLAKMKPVARKWFTTFGVWQGQQNCFWSLRTCLMLLKLVQPFNIWKELPEPWLGANHSFLSETKW